MPTEFGQLYRYESLPYFTTKKSNIGCWSSACVKVVRLCCLGILFPILFIVLPVYIRYVVYGDSTVTLAASDMILMDGHMSTSWCQSQYLRTNVSFDAYLMKQSPNLDPKAQKVSMIRHFELDDDLKEYWGFYLLRGSEVTVTSCARYLGANVMLIKGMSSLKFCAYVGEQSNEDMESSEGPEVEEHKLLEQYNMATDERLKIPSPPMFKQHNKNDKSRILQLLKTRNEKRKIIKLLEKESINSDKEDRNSSQATSDMIRQVENALNKILHQELQSLYKEVKEIIFSSPKKETENTTPASEDVVIKAKVNNRKVTSKTDSVLLKRGNQIDRDLAKLLIEEILEDENAAFEIEDIPSVNLTSDGIAQDRGTIDHRHPNDTSHSQEESSFSSSEEAMLHCRGVLLSQPLIPDYQCQNSTNPTHNSITYTVDEDAYYYFIFSSANEKVPNKLTVKFELEKTVFNTTNAISSCHNATSCVFPLHFASGEKVIVGVPAPNSSYSSVWDQTFVIESVCEPRMPVYLFFLIALPFLILICAFR